MKKYQHENITMQKISQENITIKISKDKKNINTKKHENITKKNIKTRKYQCKKISQYLLWSKTQPRGEVPARYYFCYSNII